MEVITTCRTKKDTVYYNKFQLPIEGLDISKISKLNFLGIRIPSYPVPDSYNKENYHHDDILDILLSNSLNTDLTWAKYDSVNKLYNLFDIPVPALMFHIPDHEFYILIVSKRNIREIEWVYEPVDKIINHVELKLNAYTPQNHITKIDFSYENGMFNIINEPI